MMRDKATQQMQQELETRRQMAVQMEQEVKLLEKWDSLMEKREKMKEMLMEDEDLQAAVESRATEVAKAKDPTGQFPNFPVPPSAAVLANGAMANAGMTGDQISHAPHHAPHHGHHHHGHHHHGHHHHGHHEILDGNPPGYQPAGLPHQYAAGPPVPGAQPPGPVYHAQGTIQYPMPGGDVSLIGGQGHGHPPTPGQFPGYSGQFPPGYPGQPPPSYPGGGAQHGGPAYPTQILPPSAGGPPEIVHHDDGRRMAQDIGAEQRQSRRDSKSSRGKSKASKESRPLGLEVERMQRPVVGALTPLGSARSGGSRGPTYGAAINAADPFDTGHRGRASSSGSKVPAVPLNVEGDFMGTVRKDAKKMFMVADIDKTGYISLNDVLPITRQIFYSYGLASPEDEVIELRFRAYAHLQDNDSVMIDQQRYVELCEELAKTANR